MKTNHTKDERKPSEIFEGENSSLRKTFDEAIKDEQSEVRGVVEETKSRFYKRYSDKVYPKKLTSIVNEVSKDFTETLQHLQEQHLKEKRELVEEILETVGMERDLSPAKKFWFLKSIKTIATNHGLSTKEN